MGSIAVDKAIAKLGTPKEFYQQLEPDQIAEHIVTVFEPDLPAADRRHHAARAPAALARPAPPGRGQAVVDPGPGPAAERSSATITDEIGEHIDQLLDPKIMVIDHFQQQPRPGGRGSSATSASASCNLMVTFGFVFGFLLGIPVAVVDHWFGQWWLLPVLGVVVGWVTNALGMWLIFEPPEPRRILGHQGARAVPAPPGRGRRGLRADHRRRRDHPRADRRLPPRRPARRPDPAAARRRRCGPPSTRPPGRCAAPSGSPSGSRQLRQHPRGRRRRGGRTAPIDAVPGPGLQPTAGREDPRP